MMNTTELVDILKADPFTKHLICIVHDGVHASNQLKKEESPAIYIINTDPAWKPGRHWVAIYKGEETEYFDSFGEEPTVPAICEFLNEYKYNTHELQQSTSSTCGHYCIYYLIHRCRGYSMENITSRFGSDKKRNDVNVYQYVTNLVIA